MKTFKISSPAYKANGLNGTYYSIAICDENNVITDIIGDHWFILDKYKGEDISCLVGITFTDADRYTSIEEVCVSIEALISHREKYENQNKAFDAWYKEENQFCRYNKYDFFYTKNGERREENIRAHECWLKNNPQPVQSVKYYDFLNLITA